MQHGKREGEIDERKLASRLKGGIVVDDVKYKAIEVKVLRQPRGNRNAWLELRLWEGKNREIRNVMNALGYQVSRLIRTGFGPFGMRDADAHVPRAQRDEKGVDGITRDLKPGQVVEVPRVPLRSALPEFFGNERIREWAGE